MNMPLRTVALSLVAAAMSLSNSAADSSVTSEGSVTSTTQPHAVTAVLAGSRDNARPASVQGHRPASVDVAPDIFASDLDALKNALQAEVRSDLSARLRSENRAAQ